jgi:hypothetical protein
VAGGHVREGEMILLCGGREGGGFLLFAFSKKAICARLSWRANVCLSLQSYFSSCET